jgi:hypothetical protein
MSALKQDPAKMLIAKTAIEQKGQERLQRIKKFTYRIKRWSIVWC